LQQWVVVPYYRHIGRPDTPNGKQAMNEWFEAEQHVERAHELFEAGRLDEAEVELRAALSSRTKPSGCSTLA